MKKIKNKAKQVNNSLLGIGRKSITHFTSYYSHIIWLFILFTFASFVIFLTVFILASKSYQRSIERSREGVKEYYYWKQVADSHPDFPDGLIQAARYSYALGYIDEALGYLEKALIHDSKSQRALELQEKILREEK